MSEIMVPRGILNIVNTTYIPYGGVLYEVCNYNPGYFNGVTLTDKMRLVGSIHNLSLSVDKRIYALGDELNEVAQKLEKGDYFRTTMQKLAQISLRFDNSPADMLKLREAISTVIEFSERLFKVVNECMDGRQTIVPAYFCSTFLHCCAPQAVFACNGRTYRSQRHLFAQNKFEIDGEVISAHLQGELEDFYRTVCINFGEPVLKEKCPRDFELINVQHHAMRSYALCTFIEQFGTTDERKFAWPILADMIYGAIKEKK